MRKQLEEVEVLGVGGRVPEGQHVRLLQELPDKEDRLVLDPAGPLVTLLRLREGLQGSPTETEHA